MPREQVREVLRRVDLYAMVRPFSRCTRCNGLLNSVKKNLVDHRLEPKTRRYYQEFLQCSECGQIYWQGSHHQRAQRLIKEFLAKAPTGSG